MSSISSKIAALGLLCLVACGGKEKREKEVPLPPRALDLVTAYKERLAFALSKTDSHGWLESECDAALWNGKFSCGGGNPDLTAAEYPDEPGRFNRKPLPGCGPQFGNSRTTWSRDMGMGLMAHAWCKKDLPLLNRHAAYGEKKNWVMGSPLADGRVVYVPSTIGTLYGVIWASGGQDNPSRLFPQVYPSGLNDYTAHLQMINIWLWGEINEAKGVLQVQDISREMYARIVEHSDREPECPFYQYMRGIYDGDLGRAVETLMAREFPQCEYGREDFGNKTAEWLFVAKLTLKKLGLEHTL